MHGSWSRAAARALRLAALMLPLDAAAQPVVAPFQSSGETFVLADDAGVVSTTLFGQPVFALSDTDLGHLSDPFGAMWDVAYQDCLGDAHVSGGVVGPAAPNVSGQSLLEGTQNGTTLVSNVACTASSIGMIGWGFAFYSPTFWSIGGQLLPIAFNVSGRARATGSCSGSSYCVPQSHAQITVREAGILRGSTNADEAGPNESLLDVDLVADMSNAWTVHGSANAPESGREPVLGASGSGSSFAAVDQIRIFVDFAASEALIQLADPSLGQAVIDQGLADLQVVLSPEVDLTAFAPQFPLPEPDFAQMLAAGAGALLLLERRRRRRRSLALGGHAQGARSQELPRTGSRLRGSETD